MSGLQGSPMDNALVDGDIVHLFLPPVIVAKGACRAAVWSDDGQYLLVVSEHLTIPPKLYQSAYEGKAIGKPPSMDVSINMYSVRTGEAKEIWSGSGVVSTRAQAAFFAKSDVAIVEISGRDSAQATQVFRVSAGSSKVELVETLPDSGGLSSDPGGKFVAVIHGLSVRFITPTGPVFKRQPLPGVWGFRWGAGSVPFMLDTNREVVVITPGGDFRKVSTAPKELEPSENESKIEASTSSATLPGKEARVDLVVAYLRGASRRIIVGYDGHNPEASPTDTGVFYSTESFSVVRPVIQVDKAALDKLLAAAERTKIMSEVNQIGRALMMYASDNDDKFPTKEQLADGAIDPYLMRPGMADGFVYHGITAYGDSPATTEAGFRLCPGGRIVLYQDGHTMFMPGG
ncbi:MAG: hypothetical protein M3R13_06710 [Armatimonadota bacterium]|nr:hypothetical protein [Armatimonadota bacterium]